MTPLYLYILVFESGIFLPHLPSSKRLERKFYPLFTDSGKGCLFEVLFKL